MNEGWSDERMDDLRDDVDRRVNDIGGPSYTGSYGVACSSFDIDASLKAIYLSAPT